MGLAEIAAGLEVTAEQRDRGVAAVDSTGKSVAARLSQFADGLPCSPAAAATVVERYVSGDSVADAAHAAGIPPVTGAKALHLLGESVSPVGPTGRAVVRDWLAGELPRTEAIELSRTTETEFALAVYVETHEPLTEAREAVEAALLARYEPAEDPLKETHSEPADLL